MRRCLRFGGRRRLATSAEAARARALPERMRAVEVLPAMAGTKRPGADCLSVASCELPSVRRGEVLIRVSAAGVNRPDVMQRLGLYAPPKGHSQVLGLEVAGEVVALGPGENASGLAVGDAVVALANGGGYAEFTAVPCGQVLRRPAGLSDLEAAGIPETFFTVWHTLFQQSNLFGERLFESARLRAPSLLIHGGSSGIGTTAIQLARAFGARHIVATAGSDAKCAACTSLGATAALNYRSLGAAGAADLAPAVLEATGGEGVDLVLDMVVGGGYLQQNLDVLREGGRLAIIGFLGGAKGEVNMTKVLTKALTVSGCTLRSRSDALKAGIASDLRERVWPLLESREVRVVMDSSFPLEEAAKAHRRMEEGAHVGKIILEMGA
eukprot:TRINITY_DN23728_c0_g1_i1.p1 TRINITY_DN23728_c0_g1~~TRINITY_DN23728_c0_g1_i1.p1  ORF type:complete len:407 (+),score=109.87 TRINITY_DN23728_c0_g1_i1:78-1223(+)